jgi:uncharacterized protein (TIGR02231 family)
MKNLILLLLSIPFAGFAQDHKQQIETPVSSVIVYLTGGEFMHKKQLTLSPGRNELVFVGLSAHLIAKSIQFTASGDVAVLAISNRVDYLFGQKKSDEKMKIVLDSMIMMEDALAVTRGNLDAYSRERTMLEQNQKVGGVNGATAAELKASADFYVQRLMEINAEMVKLNRKQKNQQDVYNRLSQQYYSMNRREHPPMAEITVLVNNNTAAKLVSDIELRYVVSDCGWAPAYDLIAEDVGKPIDLKYRAKVFNNTDVDWKGVKMKLSTADPMASATAPQLEKWTLNFDQPQYYKQQNYQQQQTYGYNDNNSNAPATLQSQNVWNESAAKGNSDSEEEHPAVQYEQIQVSELAAEFDIKQTYDIPADGQPYIVDVTSYTLNASYRYNCIPKMEREAFLMARITGWEDLDLVEGPANVYFGGTYVGQSYIYTRSVNDTLDLSLGRDKKLVVTRTKLKEFNQEKPSSSTKKETYSYEIVVKNTRKTAVEVELMDQIPVSQDAEIIVETQELSKGVLDPATGFVTWHLNIPPGETARVVLTYSIKYPKNKQVNTRKYKYKTRARF